MPVLERYFYKMIGEGNRNNTLFRYGAVLLDGGYSVEQTKEKIVAFNASLDKPIPIDELEATVLKSIATKAAKKGQ